MKKIPTIFIRNPDKMSEILKEAHSDCEWVFNGEGVATRKYDGTCCLIKNGKLFRRREVKKGRLTPVDFILVGEDSNTGKKVGWIPVNKDNKSDKWHIEAFNDDLSDGTYELLGPKIQGNPEGLETHELLKHSHAEAYNEVPRTYEDFKQPLLFGFRYIVRQWHNLLFLF